MFISSSLKELFLPVSKNKRMKKSENTSNKYKTKFLPNWNYVKHCFPHGKQNSKQKQIDILNGKDECVLTDS